MSTTSNVTGRLARVVNAVLASSHRGGSDRSSETFVAWARCRPMDPAPGGRQVQVRSHPTGRAGLATHRALQTPAAHLVGHSVPEQFSKLVVISPLAHRFPLMSAPTRLLVA